MHYVIISEIFSLLKIIEKSNKYKGTMRDVHIGLFVINIDFEKSMSSYILMVT